MRIYRGPFTLPTTPIKAKPNGNVIIGKGSSLQTRLSTLTNTREMLKSCHDLSALQKKILDRVLHHFHAYGKSAVYIRYWIRDDYLALTIAENVAPIPDNASICIIKGEKDSDYPIQSDLIKKAIETRDLAFHESENEEFLAVPLVSKNRKKDFGVLLLSNRYRNSNDKFTLDDIEVARVLGEIASEAISRFVPHPPPHQYN